MSLALSWALSIPSGAQVPPCLEQVRLITNQEASIRMTSCCSNRFSLCILQGADKTFLLSDLVTADFSGASEITFDLYRAGINTLSYSVSGGQISQPNDYQVSFDVPGSDSLALLPGKHEAELWVTFTDGTRIGSLGTMTVEDTRKYD